MPEGKRVAARIIRICVPLQALAMLLSACAGVVGLRVRRKCNGGSDDEF